MMEHDVRDTFKTIFDKLDSLKDLSYKEISAMKEDMGKLFSRLSALEKEVEAHITQSIIHHYEPCDSIKDLKNKLWGLLVLVLIAILSNILSWIFK